MRVYDAETFAYWTVGDKRRSVMVMFGNFGFGRVWYPGPQKYSGWHFFKVGKPDESLWNYWYRRPA